MINKGLAWGTVVVVTSMMLTGCGSDAPEDIAKTFVTSLSEADMDNARDVASENTKKKIDRLESLCNKGYYKELTNEVLTVYKTINSSNAIADLGKKINDSEIQDEMKKNFTKVKEELIEKYGSFKKAPKSIQNKVIQDMKSEMISKYIKPMISDVFDELKIETKHPDEVKNITSRLIMAEVSGGQRYGMFNSRANAVNSIIEQGNYKNIDNVTAECVAKYTDYDFIDSVNIIELKQKSADKAHVRLELIDKDDKSTKVSVSVEKIKDEWKVSNLPLKW